MMLNQKKNSSSWYRLLQTSLISFVFIFLSSCSLFKPNVQEKEGLEKISRKKSFIIYDFEQGKIVERVGDCQIQESPCSTFKIALSLMGFDSGILKDDDSPEWPYKNEYNASLDFWRQPHTPKMWIKNSCVWYSQVLTSILGMDTFQKYVKAFEYGNQDVSGNPGKDDGLYTSWLCSSLKISPQQQVEFIKKLLNHSLSVSNYAHDQTRRILFNSDLGDGWKLYAKTGGGVEKNKTLAWFVGWTKHEAKNKIYIFACLMQSHDDELSTSLAIARQSVLSELSKLRGLNGMQEDRSVNERRRRT